MKPTFTRLDDACRASLGRLDRLRPEASQLAERWAELVGPYLAGKIEPRLAAGRGIDIVLLDSRCRRAVEAVLPRLEEKVKAAFPGIETVRLR
ncbi:MAG: hypothetical protein ACRD16_16545 [Thermoanaerobaculia bacterium]